MPQDVKVSPDGKVFYIADMMSDGIWMVDGDSFTKIGFIDTGIGAHGLYPSRDGKLLYITNRGHQPNERRLPGQGSISVLDFATRKVVKKWVLPGRHQSGYGQRLRGRESTLALRALRSRSLRYRHRGRPSDQAHPCRLGPHGLCVYPQPGRYSLGHTPATCDDPCSRSSGFYFNLRLVTAAPRYSGTSPRSGVLQRQRHSAP